MVLEKLHYAWPKRRSGRTEEPPILRRSSLRTASLVGHHLRNLWAVNTERNSLLSSAHLLHKELRTAHAIPCIPPTENRTARCEGNCSAQTCELFGRAARPPAKLSALRSAMGPTVGDKVTSPRSPRHNPAGTKAEEGRWPKEARKSTLFNC
jgi:hypothetical protein